MPPNTTNPSDVAVEEEDAPSLENVKQNLQDSPSCLLNLFLGIDTDAPRLDSSTWDFLSLQELYQLRSLSKSIHQSLTFVEYTRCRDGRDYLVPFPAFPGILATQSDLKVGAGLFCHQLASLSAMHRAENSNTAFGALRGGILGDAPGLGKTITMLAHIANTAGCKPVEPKEFYDNESIDEHWKMMRVNPVFRVEILKALKPLRDAARSQVAINVVSHLSEYVSPPYSDDRFPTLTSFERFVRATMKPYVSQGRLDMFRRNVISFKAGFDKRNRRFLSTEKGRRMLLERNLIPCSSTLIIVPDALLEHWAEQIRRHINLEVFADENDGEGSSDGTGEGVVYIDGIGDISTARFPLNHSTMPMASSFQLVRFMIVVVPFSRIKEQYHSRKRRRNEDTFDEGDDDGTGSYSSCSPLLQIRWLRIVVDEGHELGENEASSDVTKFINDIASERRWCMSGTPTTGDEDSPVFTARGLDQLQRILLFLRHEKYGTCPVDNTTSKTSKVRNRAKAKSAWESSVKLPFLAKEESGRNELYQVLDEIMVMHKKEDISLPKPIFKQGQEIVPVPTTVQSIFVEAVNSSSKGSRPEVSTILSVLQQLGVNTRMRRVDFDRKIQAALDGGGQCLFDLMLSEYLTTDNYQLLVDQKQGEYIAKAVRREQKALEERGGALLIENKAATDICLDNWIDRRPIKAVVYSESHNNLLSVAQHIYESFHPENVAELTEGRISDMAYELGRFRNGFKEGKNCPICGGWNEFSGKKLTRCNNMLMEVADEEGRTYLIETERVLRAVSYENTVGNPVSEFRLGGAPLSEYKVARKFWRVGDTLLIDARDPHPLLQKRWDDETWEEYGSAKCLELAESNGSEGRDGFLGPLPEYDESGEVLVRLRKWQHCGNFHSRNRWYKGPTVENAEMKRELEDVFILLLDASLSHGLDLSFVTHLFLLEPIDDAALLEQVTSRAHRLGCSGPVTVETVNVWYGLDPETEKFADDLIEKDKLEMSKQNMRAVCEHCYRSFEDKEKAETHELKCERNPDSSAVVDPFHLSSVYRDIRPPPAMLIDACNIANNEL